MSRSGYLRRVCCCLCERDSSRTNKKKPLCILGVVSEQLFNVVSVFLSHAHTHSFFQNILQCFKNKFHFLVFRSGSAYVGNQLFLPGGMDIIDRSKRFAVSHFFFKHTTTFYMFPLQGPPLLSLKTDLYRPIS